MASPTKDALAERRAAGVVLGRPRQVPADLVARIRKERAEGSTLSAIAARLNEERVPTVHGGRKWWPGSVARYLC
jgi:hypothetical protein